jgi:hypothetical protein
MRYIHKWYTPIRVIVFGVEENFYYAPSYDPRKLPATTLNALIAVPYENIMPQVKAWLLEDRS